MYLGGGGKVWVRCLGGGGGSSRIVKQKPSHCA